MTEQFGGIPLAAKGLHAKLGLIRAVLNHGTDIIAKMLIFIHENFRKLSKFQTFQKHFYSGYFRPEPNQSSSEMS